MNYKSFRYTIWFTISEKIITRCTFFYRGGAHMHQTSQQIRHTKSCVTEFPEYMNTYLLTEGKNFKLFWAVVTYLLIKRGAWN